MAYAASVPDFARFNSELRYYEDTPEYPIAPRFVIPTGYRVQKVFDDSSRTGFKAIAFTSINAVGGVILAFAGTDGRNHLDWKSNLNYGWTQWVANRDEVFQYLDGLRASDGVSPYIGKIHFTGQSLGGGLAEYAAYQYLARFGADQLEAKKELITVTTFNGFGSSQILEQELGSIAYNSSLLAGLSESASYYVANDLISRLGNGHSGVPQYLLDYRSNSRSSNTGLAFYLDPFSAHVIERGFYDKLNPIQGFDQAGMRPKPNAPIVTTFIQPIANRAADRFQAALSMMGGVLNMKTAIPADAEWSSAPAMLVWFQVYFAGTFKAPVTEVRDLSRAVVDSFRRGGAFAAGGSAVSETRLKAFTNWLASGFGPLTEFLSGVSSPVETSREFASTIARLFSSSAGPSSSQRRAIEKAIKDVNGIDVSLGSLSDADLYRQARLAIAAIPGGELFPGDGEAFDGLTLDRTAYMQAVQNDNPNWWNSVKSMLQQAALGTVSGEQDKEAKYANYGVGFLALFGCISRDAGGHAAILLAEFV